MAPVYALPSPIVDIVSVHGLVELHTAHSHGNVIHQVSCTNLLELYSLGKAIIGEVKGQMKRMHGAGYRFWNKNNKKAEVYM